MDKKIYITPATIVVLLKMDGLLSGQSLIISSKTVTSDNSVFSREDNVWDDEN